MFWGTCGVLLRDSVPWSEVRPLPRLSHVPSFPGPGFQCQERPRETSQRALRLRAGVQGPAVTHTRGPWSRRRGASSQRTGPDLGPCLLVCTTRSSGELPQSSSQASLCPFCSFYTRITYMVSSVPCAVPCHPLLPRARPLRIVPAASPDPIPAAQDSASPSLGPLGFQGSEGRGAGRAFCSPPPSAEPCVLCTSPEGEELCVLSPHNQDPHLQIKGSEWGEVLKSCS